MPTYQYACTECGHSFEQVQSFTDDSLTVCPVCEGKLRKVYNAVGVVFKGSGFYRTDSRPAGESSGGGSSKGGDSSSSDSSGSGDKKAGSDSSSAPKKSDSSSSSSSSSSAAKPSTSPST